MARIIGGSAATQVYLDIVDYVDKRLCVRSSNDDSTTANVAPQTPVSKRAIRREKRLRILEQKTTTSRPIGSEHVSPAEPTEGVIADALPELEKLEDSDKPPLSDVMKPPEHEPSDILEDGEVRDAEDEEPPMDYETQVMLGLIRRSAPPPSCSGVSEDLREHPKVGKSNKGRHRKVKSMGKPRPASTSGDPLGIPSKYMEEPSAEELRNRRDPRSRKTPAPRQYREPRDSGYQKKWNKPAPTRAFFYDSDGDPIQPSYDPRGDWTPEDYAYNAEISRR